MQRIMVDNFVSYNTNSRVCSILSGIPGYDIKDIKLSNVYIQHRGGDYADLVKVVPPENEDKYPDPGMFGPMPSAGFFFRHVRNLELSHVEVAPMNPDPRPSFYLHGVTRADFIAVTAPTSPAAFTFNKTNDVRIALSRAARDTQLASADKQSL
jgi:hypothetical protein